MFVEEDEIHTLRDLGLTPREAKVFLILTQSGILGARALTKASKLPRQDTYKVLTGLEQLGLVEKTLSNPTEFKAIPFQEASTILISRRRQITACLQQKMERMTEKMQENCRAKMNEDKDPRISIIPKGEAFVHRIKKSIENAEKSIDVISPRHALHGIFYLSEILYEALRRGVLVRFLVDNLDFEGSRLATFQTFLESPYFKVKKVPNQTTVRFCIYDNKEISIVLSSMADFSKCSLLWTDCSSLIVTYQEYYEMLWHAATDPDFVFQFKEKNYLAPPYV